MIGTQAHQRDQLAIEQIVADFPEKRIVLGDRIVVSVYQQSGKHERIHLRPLPVLIGATHDPVQGAIGSRVHADFLREHLRQELARERP